MPNFISNKISLIRDKTQQAELEIRVRYFFKEDVVNAIVFILRPLIAVAIKGF